MSTQKKTPEYKCESCKSKPEFRSYESLQKHRWTYHPSNNIEKAWAKHAREGFENWTGSSYYESYGPYY